MDEKITTSDNYACRNFDLDIFKTLACCITFLLILVLSTSFKEPAKVKSNLQYL